MIIPKDLKRTVLLIANEKDFVDLIRNTFRNKKNHNKVNVSRYEMGRCSAVTVNDSCVWGESKAILYGNCVMSYCTSVGVVRKILESISVNSEENAG